MTKKLQQGTKMSIPSTYVKGRPWTLLPLPPPADYSPAEEYGEGFFYEHVAKPLIDTTVRLMDTGLPIDLNKVAELEREVDIVLQKVEDVIESNSVIQAYYEWKYPQLLKEHRALYESKIQTPEKYLREFNPKKIEDRSYYMYCFIKAHSEECFDVITPPEYVYADIPKWKANDVKKLVYTIPSLEPLAAGTISPTDTIAVQAMELFATHKADMFNTRHDYINRLNSNKITDIVPKFNPASSDQKHELFTGMLGLESDILSDAYQEWDRDCKVLSRRGVSSFSDPPKNKYSWARTEVEKLLPQFENNPDMQELLQALIDHSFAAIIRQNFIESFYKYTVDGILYGQYKLLGAKSGRYTSSNPNMLNAPSTGSVYAKPMKKCFTAPKDYVIAAIDYSALEDRVIASLTKDVNKCAIFTEGVDGHSLGACAYFPEQVAAEMELTGDTIADAKEFKRLVDEGNKVLKVLRQDGKKVTFGLSYGAHPPKVANTLKIPLEEAQKIFDNYHNVLYSGITDYRENYVLPVCAENGRIHLGLGFYISTDRPGKDIRTLNNATCQFWSILTAIAINEINHRIDEMGYTNDIYVTSTIYDSIYMIVKEDAEIISWLNENLVSIMVQDFMIDQEVHNEANLELGTDWANLIELPNNASLEEIQSILNKLKED